MSPVAGEILLIMSQSFVQIYVHIVFHTITPTTGLDNHGADWHRAAPDFSLCKAYGL